MGGAVPATRVLHVGCAGTVSGPRADGCAGIPVRREGESDEQGSDARERPRQGALGGEHDDPPELRGDAVPVSEPGVLHVLRNRADRVGGRIGALELSVVRAALPPGDVHGREDPVHLLRQREARERALRLHAQLVPDVSMQMGVSSRLHGSWV